MTMILIPAAIVAGIGLIAAVILTVASKLMFVPVDERVAAVREVLPGANCGGCGSAGCDDYAAAFGRIRISARLSALWEARKWRLR